ncbi:uncharacterized protein LOC133920024 [Phragmites australis]|uniref:uncharacterized protein LOC133920024 n=1 Tax=Phragmites australis TaxID=29695 RepID=UPI002D779672|nr:uncharacterized protein LOC133920024 [Phragmites australis]
MAGACAVAVANSNLAPRHSFLRVSCRQSPRAGAPAGARNRAARGRARLSRRDPAEAETEAGVGQALKDSSYLWTLLLGSVGGAAAIKYGSILLPDITRPNIVQALLMVSLPVVAAVLLLLKASSTED